MVKKFIGKRGFTYRIYNRFYKPSLDWIGFFIINRDINGTALVTFLFLGAMVLGHLFIIKKN